MRKWQLALTVIFSAIGIGLSSGNQVKADLVPGVQDNIQLVSTPNANMRVVPGSPGTQYGPTQGIMAVNGTNKAANGSIIASTPMMSGLKNTDSTTDALQDDGKSHTPIYIKIRDDGRWFAMNYVSDPTGKLPFLTSTTTMAGANNFTSQGSVTNKMNPSTQTLATGQNYDGGYLNVSGNVPIFAKFLDNQSVTDNLMLGNWGVMVKFTMPVDVDLKSVANAIMWDKDYFNLSLTLTSLTGLGSFNFPLAFDHHVYEDPSDARSFYLKVKGVPFYINANTTDGYSVLINNNDVNDNNNNVNNSGSSLAAASSFTPKALGWFGETPGVFDGVQKFGSQNMKGGGTSGWAAAGPILGYGALFPSGQTPFGIAAGLTNFINPNSDAGRGTGISTILTGFAKGFTTAGFKGDARINFNIDISKYNGNLSSGYRTLTRGRLFPSSRADGKFNANPTNPTDTSQNSVFIDVYGTDQLVYPSTKSGQEYTQFKAYDKTALTTGNSVPGKLPMDFAVVNANADKSGSHFPLYTNLTSWNSFIAPADNKPDATSNYDTEPDANDSVGPTVTPNGAVIPTTSDPGAASDIWSRTVTPDYIKDGVFVSPYTSGTTFGLKNIHPYTNDAESDVTPKAISKCDCARNWGRHTKAIYAGLYVLQLSG